MPVSFGFADTSAATIFLAEGRKPSGHKIQNRYAIGPCDAIGRPIINSPHFEAREQRPMRSSTAPFKYRRPLHVAYRLR